MTTDILIALFGILNVAGLGAIWHRLGIVETQQAGILRRLRLVEHKAGIVTE